MKLLKFILLLLVRDVAACVCMLNPLTRNDAYSGRTAPLNSKSFILYIYSTNTGTDYF